ncbi:MAG: FxsA family protein [Gammaproteobacteria bacterium]|nr:FxsA family protein [Gammaproteobacteria bacterium]
MLRILLLLLIAVPIIEIYLFIQVGSAIGAWSTIGLVILTAVPGTFLLRQQGLSTLARVQTTLQRGEIPALEMVEGVILVIAGVLLIIPGFFTDTLGFLLLLPVFRRRLVMGMLRHANVIRTSHVHYRNHQGPTSPHKSNTLEGEYRRED